MTIADKARDAAMHCEAKKHAYRQTQDGVVVSFVLHPHEVPDGLATAPLGSRYMLALVEISDDESPVQPEEASAVPPRQNIAPHAPQPDGAGKREHMDWRDVSPAAQSGIRANDPTFRAFLREIMVYPDVDSVRTAEIAIRHLCQVVSRTELSTDHRKRVLWHQLDSQFQAWQARERAS